MKAAAYLSLLLATLCACTPAQYNLNHPTKYKSSKMKRMQNPAFLQGLVWKALQMVKFDQFPPEEKKGLLVLIVTLTEKDPELRPVQNLAVQLLAKFQNNSLSKAEFIKGLEDILHKLEGVTGMILKPNFEEFRKRYL